MPEFPSLAALNDWLETRCRELWAQTLTARSSARSSTYAQKKSGA